MQQRETRDAVAMVLPLVFQFTERLEAILWPDIERQVPFALLDSHVQRADDLLVHPETSGDLLFQFLAADADLQSSDHFAPRSLDPATPLTTHLRTRRLFVARAQPNRTSDDGIVVCTKSTGKICHAEHWV